MIGRCSRQEASDDAQAPWPCWIRILVKMEHGIRHLASIIAAHLREWNAAPPFVELAIFETSDALPIARAIDAFCLGHLGAHVTRGLFHQSSNGSVTGVELEDERRLVIKAHRPYRTSDFLAEVRRIQSHLTERGVFAPKVVAGPLPLGQGHAMVETFIEIGQIANGHRPEIRRALARALWLIVATCANLTPSTSLGPGLLSWRAVQLWPKPYSELFDFGTMSQGAKWIDEVAARARKRMKPAGVHVIGHSDWRQEHVRFVGEEPVAAFDWDSLCCDLEPCILGRAALGFCADWSRKEHAQAPTLSEALAFIREYEEARGSVLSAQERRLAHASLLYAGAFSARCSHAPGVDTRATEGTFQHFLWAYGTRLLQL